MDNKDKRKVEASKLRKISLFSLVIIVATVLTGCTSSPSSSNTTSQTTLYWWRSQSDASKETLQTMIDGFQADNPSIKIEVVLKSPNTYLEDATEALAANQTVENAPDILSVDSYDLPKIAAQLSTAPDDLFVDTTKTTGSGTTAVETVQDTFVSAAAKSVVLNDPTTSQAKLFGLPIGIDSLVLFRNTSLLETAATNLKTENKVGQQYSDEEIKTLKKKIQATPKTWSALSEIAPLITIKDGNSISLSAISMGTSTNVERSYDILQSIMMQNGTSLTSDDLNTATFNQSALGAASSTNPGQKALSFYLRFSNPNDPLYSWNNDMPNSYEAFKNEQSAMMIHYGSTYNILINEASSLKNKIDIQPLPQIVDPDATTSTNQIKEMAKMWVETAPSAKGDAKKQAAAWKFIKYISSKQGSSTYLSAMKMSSALKEGSDRAKFEALTTQKTTASAWYKGSDATSVDKAFISMINDAAAGNKSAADALDSAASSVTKILQSSKVKWSTASISSLDSEATDE